MTEITLAPGRPITLADLRQFVERCGEFGIPDASEIKAQVSLGGKVKRLTVVEVAEPPKDDGRGTRHIDVMPKIRNDP